MIKRTAEDVVDMVFRLSTGRAICRQKVAYFTGFVDKSVDKR